MYEFVYYERLKETQWVDCMFKLGIWFIPKGISSCIMKVIYMGIYLLSNVQTQNILSGKWPKSNRQNITNRKTQKEKK